MFGNKNAGLMDAIVRTRGSEQGTKLVRVPSFFMALRSAQIAAAARAPRETYFASSGALRCIR